MVDFHGILYFRLKGPLLIEFLMALSLKAHTDLWLIVQGWLLTITHSRSTPERHKYECTRHFTAGKEKRNMSFEEE